jgi:hypothetical protein
MKSRAAGSAMLYDVAASGFVLNGGTAETKPFTVAAANCCKADMRITPELTADSSDFSTTKMVRFSSVSNRVILEPSGSACTMIGVDGHCPGERA